MPPYRAKWHIADYGTALMLFLILFLLLRLISSELLGPTSSSSGSTDSASLRKSADESSSSGYTESGPDAVSTSSLQHHQDIRRIGDHGAHSLGASGAGVWWQLMMRTIDGTLVDMEQYSTHVVLVVNVASHCGFTEMNYNFLPKLYDKFYVPPGSQRRVKAQGEDAALETASTSRRRFTVLAFPCNQFGRQEADPPAWIAKYARERKHARFPIMQKIDVNGQNEAEIYIRLKRAVGVPNVEWNFAKFLVAPGGKVLQYFKHDDALTKVENAVEALMSE